MSRSLHRHNIEYVDGWWRGVACSGVLVYLWRVMDGGDLGMIVVRWLVGRITHGRTKKLHGYTDTGRMDTQHTRDDEQ